MATKHHFDAVFRFSWNNTWFIRVEITEMWEHPAALGHLGPPAQHRRLTSQHLGNQLDHLNLFGIILDSQTLILKQGIQ